MSDDVDKVVKSLEPEVVLNIGRDLRPIVSEMQRKTLVTAFATGDEAFSSGKSPRRHQTVCSADWKPS